MNFNELKKFLENTMEMNQIYQPVVIRYLLKNGFSSDRDSIEAELSRTSENEINFIHDSAIYDICGVLEKRNVISSDNSNQKFGKITLTLNEKLTEFEIKKLIQICDYNIIDWEIKNKNDKNIFLIQIGKLGGKDFDKDIYRHVDWQKTKKDIDHGKIKPGDFILFYFSTKAKVKEGYQGILKTFCKVMSTESNNEKIHFLKLAEFNGLEFELIKSLKNVLKEKVIPYSFDKVATEKFNVKEISKDDFDILYQVDKKHQNIFLCSIQSEAAFSHFQDTVLNSQNTNELNIEPIYKKYPKLCIWGTKFTSQYYTHWSKIKNGDIILFFKDYYRYAGILLGIENNKKVADKLWGTDNDQSWEQIMYILPQNLIEISVDKEKLNDIIPGYTPNAYPRNNNPFYRIKSESTLGMMINEN